MSGFHTTHICFKEIETSSGSGSAEYPSSGTSNFLINSVLPVLPVSEKVGQIGDIRLC